MWGFQICLHFICILHICVEITYVCEICCAAEHGELFFCTMINISSPQGVIEVYNLCGYWGLDKPHIALEYVTKDRQGWDKTHYNDRPGNSMSA